MRNGFLIVLAFLGLFAQGAGISEQHLCRGFLPPNNMYIPETRIRPQGIARDKFDEILNRLEAIYAPIISSQGGVFKIDRRWSDGTVNAYADRVGRTWKIVMFGGMARHPAVTYDGFAAVACHEIGHHIGGAPKFAGDWASIEGESDYFSHLKCLRRLFLNDDNKKIVDGMQVDPVAARDCKAQHASQQDELICIRSTMAALALGQVLAEQSPNKPKLDTPDPSEVNETFTDHPAAQCRVDTLFQAALCKIPFGTDLSDSDYRQGSCYTPNFDKGARSRCWFKPD